MTVQVRRSPVVAAEVDIQEASERLRDAVEKLTQKEVAWLVDTYVRVQKNRIRQQNYIRTLGESGRPTLVFDTFFEDWAAVEERIRQAINWWIKAQAQTREVVRWLLSVRGIGPILAAGLLAHIDIHKAPTVGKIWRYAGLDPTCEWKPGQKRPWNARLKRLCFLIGDSFVKQSWHPDCFYGRLYRERLEYERKRNEAGEYAEIAKKTLERYPHHEQRHIYKKGRLPEGRLQMRARRWVVKLFLSHLHYVWYLEEYGTEPPKPYVVEHMGHADMILPPGLEVKKRKK